MALTPAEKQARYRQRQAGRLQPIPKPTRLVPKKFTSSKTPIAAKKKSATKAKAKQPKTDVAVDVSNPKAIAAATVDQLRETLHQLSQIDGAQPREISSVATALTAATRLLARLDGTFEITPTMLVRSPAWEEISTAIV